METIHFLLQGSCYFNVKVKMPSNKKTKIPSFFRKDPHCSQTLIFVLKSTTIQVFLDKKGRFCHSVDLKRRPKDEKCYKNIFCMNIEFSDNTWKCIDLLSQVNLGFDLLIFVMLSKSILQQERKLLVAKKMTLHSHG